MFVSVVIPTYNRRPILEKCLDALERQRFEGGLDQYEVVVVDDGSTDGTGMMLGVAVGSTLGDVGTDAGDSVGTGTGGT